MKLDTGWPDAVSKIGLAVVSICTLITFLVTTCNQRHEARVNRAGVIYMTGTNAMQKIERETR